MEPVPLWCIIFINCMTILSSIWILIRLYRNRSKRSASFYIYGLASSIGLILGVISFFYHICHTLCAIIIGLFLFIDTLRRLYQNCRMHHIHQLLKDMVVALFLCSMVQ